MEQQSVQEALYPIPWGPNPYHGSELLQALLERCYHQRGRSHFIHILLSDSWNSREVWRDSVPKTHGQETLAQAGDSPGPPTCNLTSSSVAQGQDQEG